MIEGKSCEWCGSTETLSVHHKNPEPSYLERYRRASQALLEKLIKEGVYTPINKIEEIVCPECGSSSVREFRPARFRCLDCSEYFTAHKKFKGSLRASKEDFEDFVKKHTSDIKESLKSEREKNSKTT